MLVCAHLCPWCVRVCLSILSTRSVHEYQGMQIVAWGCVCLCVAEHSFFLTLVVVTVVRGKGQVLAVQCVCSQIGRDQVFLSSMEMKFPEHIKPGPRPLLWEPRPYGPPAGVRAPSPILRASWQGKWTSQPLIRIQTHSQQVLALTSPLALFPELLPFRGEGVCPQRRSEPDAGAQPWLTS